MWRSGRAGRVGAATLIGAATLALTACGAAGGSSSITVSNARIPEPAGPTGAAYLTIVNDGDGADRLVAIETDVASSAEIHESRLTNGAMSMQPVEAVDVPAGGRAIFEPGGMHVMLLDVEQDLTAGDTVELSLVFDGAGEQVVNAEVIPLVGGDTEGDTPSDTASEDAGG
jgi:copper(I)-binding protein